MKTTQILSTTSSEVQWFNRVDYDKVMHSTNQNLNIHSTEGTEVEGLGDVLGWDMVNNYRCSIKRLLHHQRDSNIKCLRKEDIDSERIARLLYNVKKRKDQVAKANYKERMDGEFTPYKMIGEVNAIEDFMWNHNCETSSFSATSLRNHYQFLSTLSGVLRSDILYRGDLSDLCYFKFQKINTPDEYYIGIQRVSQGKANKDKVMYGRAMRHRDVELGSIGALGLYLLTRF